MARGYFGIGIYQAKVGENIGTLWRSAHNFGAHFIFTIGKRFTKDPMNNIKAERHLPLYHYKEWEDFLAHIPEGAEIVCVEKTPHSVPLSDFAHPQRAVYLLGAEDHGIPKEILQNHKTIHIDTSSYLNVAVSGSIVLYDRSVKSLIKASP